MNALVKKARLALAAISLLGAATAFGQTLTATDITPQAGAAGQVVSFDYTAGGNVSVVITNTALADANTILTGVTYQQFDAGTMAFVNCDGTQRFAQFTPAQIQITCTTAGRFSIQTSAPNTTALPNISNLARATFGIAGGATAGQAATFSYGANCAAGQFPNANPCTEFTTTASARVNGTVSDTGTVTVAAAPTGPTLTPPASTNVALSGGTIGQPTSGNIQYSAAGGSAGQSSTLTCSVTSGPVTITSGSPQTLTTGGAQPAPVVVQMTLTGTAQAGVVTCNGTAFNVTAPAGTPATGPTLTPPATTTIALGSTLIGGQVNTSIVYTAAGGNAGQSTTLTCTSTAPAVIVSGGTQTITTGSTPAPVVAGIVLTGAPQTGTVTCNGTTFTLNAPAGVAFVPPSIIPASSFWSQLTLIALLAALGGLFVATRRNA